MSQSSVDKPIAIFYGGTNLWRSPNQPLRGWFCTKFANTGNNNLIIVGHFVCRVAKQGQLKSV